ncbi:MAG: hypothetical protein H6774_03020 [Pseudomonadales bacterium]|nr:hypothetical protein [Pseudomonadales bacterium]
MGNKSKRGSEWKKWDLHIHSPASFFWKGSKNYLSMSAKEIEAEMKVFIKAINESDADVFCLMDYWTFDWYLELLKYKKKYPGELKKTIFPGMELRIECPVDYRLNIHVILSDQLTPQQLNDFKSELTIRLIDRKLSNEALANFAKTLDKSKAKHHGFTNENLNDEELLLLGSQTAEITKESLTKAFTQIPNGTGYIILPYDTSDGLLDLDWEKHPHDDNYFMQTAHIFETRDKRNIDLFSGIKNSENETFFDNFFKTLGSKEKPCVSGSDAHSYSDYASYPSDKITWVKAETTFEGLRQIICEPTERVKIGAVKPDTKKTYFSIDKIQITDNTGKNNFTSESIVINPNLTTIIGGKSTGKSLLLYYLAKAIDPDEVRSRIDETKPKPYDFDDDPNFNFEVSWSDGHISKLKSADLEEDNRKILYIPQNYLNKLSETNVKSRVTLNNFVMNVLLQDDEVRESYSSLQEEIKSLLRNIPTAITVLYQTRADINGTIEQIKKIGDEKGIKKYIAELEKRLNQIKQKSQLDKKEIKEYEKLREKEAETIKNITLYSSDRKQVSNFVRESSSLLSQIEEKRVTAIENLSTDEAKTILSSESSLLTKLKPNLSEKLKKVDKLIGKKIVQLNKDLVSTQKLLVPFNSKFEFQEELRKVSNQIKEEQSKLDGLSLLNKDLKNKRELFTNQKQTITSYYKQIFQNYTQLQFEFKKYESKFEDISLNVSIGFEESHFNDSVISNCLNKSDIKKQLKISGNTEYKYSFDQVSHLNFMEELFEGVINNEVKTVRNTSAKDAIIKLMDDYFRIDFKISYKNDSLDKMSPGKKGLVLLRLLINLSNEEWPILLDQPEDDLDNRSIYDDLVEFIKNKKKERQIIIVTHNPNLVVGADAEEVIVANQEGQELGRSNEKFRFEYFSGALENTFVDEKEQFILYQKGIREHVCEILEGGEEAFKKREQKYHLSN